MSDEYYCNNRLIITTSPNEEETKLMAANRKLIETINDVKTILSKNKTADITTQIREIANLLETKYINFSEFTSFFPTLDVSYSIYKKLKVLDKFAFLNIAVRRYIEKRHDIYNAHGYSNTILQVRRDFEKHKTGGNAANKKLSSIFKAHGYKEIKDNLIDISTAKCFMSLSKASSEVLIAQLKKSFKFDFKWKADHQNKSADFFFIDANKNMYICEAKHLKEHGGGQDKQITELISLISYKEDDSRIRYLAFLDGVYFNFFNDPSDAKSKEQLKQIRDNLVANKNNYFVNTFGMLQLIK